VTAYGAGSVMSDTQEGDEFTITTGISRRSCLATMSGVRLQASSTARPSRTTALSRSSVAAAWAWSAKLRTPSLAASSPLKFLPDDLSRGPRALERLRREAHAASALNWGAMLRLYAPERHFSRFMWRSSSRCPASQAPPISGHGANRRGGWSAGCRRKFRELAENRLTRYYSCNRG
jgi:hypothetical protein